MVQPIPFLQGCISPFSVVRGTQPLYNLIFLLIHAYKFSLVMVLVTVYVTRTLVAIANIGRTPVRDTNESSPVSSSSLNTRSSARTPASRRNT